MKIVVKNSYSRLCRVEEEFETTSDTVESVIEGLLLAKSALEGKCEYALADLAKEKWHGCSGCSQCNGPDEDRPLVITVTGYGKPT